MNLTHKLALSKLVCEELMELDSPDPVILEKCAIFEMMPQIIHHDLLRKVRKRKFRAGRQIVTQGAIGDGMYFCHTGALKVFVNNKLVTIMRAPAFFGEVALLTATGRRWSS